MKEHTDIQDSDLINAYRNGDSKAFAQLVYRYEQSLASFIIRMIGKKDSAEDIFQEVFLRVHKNLKNYKEIGKFNSWLFGIAHNLCIDFIRKQKFNNSLFEYQITNEDEKENDLSNNFIEAEPLPDSLYEKKELYSLISKAIQNLSLPLKEVFLLREYSKLPFREIANQLNRPLNTVLNQMRQAIIKIRIYLKKYYE